MSRQEVVKDNGFCRPFRLISGYTLCCTVIFRTVLELLVHCQCLGVCCFNCTFVIVRLSLSIAIIGKIKDDVIAWQVKWPLPINK